MTGAPDRNVGKDAGSGEPCSKWAHSRCPDHKYSASSWNAVLVQNSRTDRAAWTVRMPSKGHGSAARRHHGPLVLPRRRWDVARGTCGGMISRAERGRGNVLGSITAAATGERWSSPASDGWPMMSARTGGRRTASFSSVVKDPSSGLEGGRWKGTARRWKGTARRWKGTARRWKGTARRWKGTATKGYRLTTVSVGFRTRIAVGASSCNG